MARPRITNETKRDFTIRVRVTPAEKQLLKSSSQQQGLTLSDYMRLKSINAVPLLRKAAPERAALIKGLAELGKIGSNMNQIARSLNSQQKANHALFLPTELLNHSLQGVDMLTHHLINLLQGGH